MQLIPSAKPIRIRIVSGGEEHSSLESLRNNFSFKDIVPMVSDGRLHKWLTQKGEKESAAIAKSLIGKKLDKDSLDLLKLVASIFSFSIESNSIESVLKDIAECWKGSYPQTYKNFMFDYGRFSDIEEALEFYKNNPQEDVRNRDKVFVGLLKSMSLDDMLHRFKTQKEDIPISDGCWLTVFKHFAVKANRDELYELGEVAIDNSFMTEEALRWIEKSAEQGCVKAKGTLNKNNDLKLIDEFLKNPGAFEKLHPNKNESELVYFLWRLSGMYSLATIATPGDCKNVGKYAKYLELANAFWWLGVGGRNLSCIEILEKMVEKNPEYHYPFDVLQALNNHTLLGGKNLCILSYRELIIFVAKHVKSELQNGK